MLRLTVRKVKSSPNLRDLAPTSPTKTRVNGAKGTGATTQHAPLHLAAKGGSSGAGGAGKISQSSETARDFGVLASPVKVRPPAAAPPLAPRASMRSLGNSSLGKKREVHDLYHDKRVAELKSLLKERGFSTDGKKDQLIEKLVNADHGAGSGETMTASLTKKKDPITRRPRKLSTSAKRSADQAMTNSMAGTATETVSTLPARGKKPASSSVDNVKFSLPQQESETKAVPPLLPDSSQASRTDSHPLHQAHDLHTAAEQDRLSRGTIQLMAAHSTHHGGGPLPGGGLEDSIASGHGSTTDAVLGAASQASDAVVSTAQGGWLGSLLGDIRDDMLMAKSSLEESASRQTEGQSTSSTTGSGAGRGEGDGSTFDPLLQLTAEQSSGLYALFGIVGGGYLLSKIFGGRTSPSPRKEDEHQ